MNKEQVIQSLSEMLETEEAMTALHQLISERITHNDLRAVDRQLLIESAQKAGKEDA